MSWHADDGRADQRHDHGAQEGAARPEETANQRNGKSAKTVLTEDGPLRIEAPRDRAGSFEPILIPKHECRFTGFDDTILTMHARGMTVRATSWGCGSSTPRGRSSG